jgi:hypothetical protein
MNAKQNTSITANAMVKATAMSPLRKTSLTAGIIYLLTFVSIPTLALYGPIHNPNYILGNSKDTAVIIGGILEIIVGLTSIATAVVLYPVLKKRHEGFALGLFASRILEASTIFVAVAFLLADVTLHQNGAGTESLVVSHALVALYDRIFLLGQGFIPAINDLLLGYMLYKSRLVPRVLSVIGMAGAVPLIAGYIAVLFGFIEQRSPLAGLSAVMVAVFEFSLGIYLIVKGFKPLPITGRN